MSDPTIDPLATDNSAESSSWTFTGGDEDDGMPPTKSIPTEAIQQGDPSPSLQHESDLRASETSASSTTPPFPTSEPIERHLTARSEAIVDAAIALQRSDSVLSGSDDEEHDDEEHDDDHHDDDDHVDDTHQQRRRRRRRHSSSRYMEEASMEAIAVNGVTKISASGRAGRRRQSSTTDESIFVSDSSLVWEDNQEESSRKSISISDNHLDVSRTVMMDQSHRDVFRPPTHEQRRSSQQHGPSQQPPPTTSQSPPFRRHIKSPPIKPPMETVSQVMESIFHGSCACSDEEWMVRIAGEWTVPALSMDQIQNETIHDESVINQHPQNLVTLLSSNAILRLPVPYAAKLLRLLIRVLTWESHDELILATTGATTTPPPHYIPLDLGGDDDPTINGDHVSVRPHILYNSARLQCAFVEHNNRSSATWVVWQLWEACSKRASTEQQQQQLLPLLARLLGLFCVASVTPQVLRQMLTAAQGTTSTTTLAGRLSMVRALRTAAAGSSRPLIWRSPMGPKHFFCFSGNPQGLSRTITGLSTWPFRNDFGMALWFRAERFDKGRYPVLLSSRTDDGGGIDVSLVPLIGGKTSEACTVQVSVYNSRTPDVPARSLNVSGCILLPRVWHHLAVRHQKARLKGVFSLSTRQHLTILVDGKTMLSESFGFPKLDGIDDRDDSSSSILQTTGLRRNSNSYSRVNLKLSVCADFDGQTGAIYIFNDSVSDASFRALYEAIGGSGRFMKRKPSSAGEVWDARCSDIVRKSRVLDATMTNEDAEEIVLSQRRGTGSGSVRTLDDHVAAILDIGESEDDTTLLPADLQKSVFGSKVFLVWDPRRTFDKLAIEVHIGAHLVTSPGRSWNTCPAQDVIGSLGGVQALIPVFVSFFTESKGVATSSDSSNSKIISEIFLLLKSFVENHNDNAREFLRCGGIDVLEQILYAARRSASAALKPVYTHVAIARSVVQSLLELRAGCAHYVGLETRVFSRLLYNIPLWLGGSPPPPGVALQGVLLPVLSQLTKANPDKVRDCIGLGDLVHALKENLEDTKIQDDGQDCFTASSGGASGATTLSATDRWQVSDVLTGMIFEVLSSGGVSSHDLSPFLNFLASLFESEFKESTEDGALETHPRLFRRERCRIQGLLATTLCFLLQIRPPVPGLYESFSQCCGSVANGAAWILSAMVNSFNDEIRGLGIRCLASYLDVTAKADDLPLSLGGIAPISSSELEMGPSNEVQSSVRRLGMIAKGLAGMGTKPSVIQPSKLSARVAVKLLWHLLKSQSSDVGRFSYEALLSWISDDEGSATTLKQREVVGASDTFQPGCKFNMEWARLILAETGTVLGRSLRNPLPLEAVLRLLRYLDTEKQSHWLSDLTTLAKSSRKSLSLLSGLPDWQPCLFHLLSDALEGLSSSWTTDHTSMKLAPQPTSRGADSNGNRGWSDECRMDLCLELYASLLGHLVREGGDKALDAVEKLASLERVCTNGHDVVFLILSNLTANLYDNGTLLEMGSISAHDWKGVNIEQDSLPLKQSACLVADAILSQGSKGLDMTTAVRSWRALRHLAELIAALNIKSRFGPVDLFDYINQQASSVDTISGGLHGIRLSESGLSGLRSSELFSFARPLIGDGTTSVEIVEFRREVDRRFCTFLSAQILAVVDAFMFPDSLDAALPASQLHVLALVRHSEQRLGTSQGPFALTALRLSFVLLAQLEPCSVVLLQCVSRMRCLVFWQLELTREAMASDANAGLVSVLDRMLVATVLHSHRALGRCSALLSEIESASFDKYFESSHSQKKHVRRLMRVALELRDVVSAAYRGRTDALRGFLSSEAFEELRACLEGDPSSARSASKESITRDFLASGWVCRFQDVENILDLSVPEQLSMDAVPLSSDQVTSSGVAVIEMLAKDSASIIADFEKALNGSFEEYLERQRLWADTAAVRHLEVEGEAVEYRLVERNKADSSEMTKAILTRRTGAEYRWRGIRRKVVDPWTTEQHWKLARYPDRKGRRTLLVPNRAFVDHADASYEEREKAEREKADRVRRARLQEKDLSEMMKRNMEAFMVNENSIEVESKDDDSLVLASDGESSADTNSVDPCPDEVVVEESERDEEWDKVDIEEVKDADDAASRDAWAKTFIWSDSETVVAHFKPVMVVSLQVYVEGALLLTTHGLYFQQTSDEMSVMTKEPASIADGSGLESKHRRWRLARLTEIHGRRFLLRPQALELFFSDSHELFLNFPGGSRDRDRFYAKLRNSCKVPMLWSPKSLNPKHVFRKSKLTELWKKRKISNFDYLMALNRMAGRSFNDICQYPVFPWVLADYSSKTLDLSDYRVYRDLSKPVGALNPDRLAQLIERYKDLELFGFTEAEKFLYGSHYSSPGIVLHYLIRLEPFTTMAIELQSGRFDCPDRLFFDIASSWNGCLTSTSDMKELVPEFFCLPEMLLNTEKFPLGRTQSGKPVDDVGLPSWANGSAHEFVRINRLALESEYVSQRLNEWIDLIFGYKQRGPEAEAAHNLFHHLSYEGSVDLDKIVDDVDRFAAESHIQNFGQTPSQLLVAEPHPSRYGADECWKPLIHSTAVPQRLRCHTPAKQFGNTRSEYAKGAVLQIIPLSETVEVVYGDLSVGLYRWFPNSKSNRLRMDRVKPIARRDLSNSRAAMQRGSAVPAETLERSSRAVGNWSFAFTMGGLAKDDPHRFFDDCIKTYSAQGVRSLTSTTGGHRGAIKCISVGQDRGIMVSGGEDCTCRVWVVDHPDMAMALSDGYVQTSLGASNDGDQVLSCCHVLWGHDAPITAVDVDYDLDTVVSGSQSGLVCVHTIRKGEFIRAFSAPGLSAEAGAIRIVLVDTSGLVVVHTQDNGLHMFTVNAVHLCTRDAGEQLHAMKVCSRGEFIVTGGANCQVLIRTSNDLNVCAMLDLSRHGPIRSISLTPDDLNPSQQFLFIGSDDGMITIIDEDPTKQGDF